MKYRKELKVIRAINNYRQLCVTSYAEPKPTDTALFFSLLQYWHEQGNVKEFTLQNSVLRAVSGIRDNKTFLAARLRLEDLGSIITRPEGKKGCRYSLAPLFGEASPFDVVKKTPSKVTSYNIPNKLRPYIEACSESYYYKDVPTGIQEVTARFGADESILLDKAISEQISMSRQVVLLYNRKGISVAYRLKR